MARPASVRSLRPAAARSAPRTTAAATPVSGRPRPRTQHLWRRFGARWAWRRRISSARSARSMPPLSRSGTKASSMSEPLVSPPAGADRPAPAPRRTPPLTAHVLTRVDGEGGMKIKVLGNRVADVKLRIYEPPRFFEGLLRGRHFTEAPDITARICGICPAAYQMSAIHAMEAACGVEVDGPIRDLRRLLYCGEWIESHVLHIAMLHAPDFLGYASALEMAKEHGR